MTSPPDLKKHIPLRRFDSPIANLPLRGSSGDSFAMLSNQAAGIFAAHHPLDVDAVHRLLDSGQDSPSPRARPLPGRSQPAKNPRSCHNAPTRLPVSPPRHHKLRNCPAPSPSRESNSSSTVSRTPARELRSRLWKTYTRLVVPLRKWPRGLLCNNAIS